GVSMGTVEGLLPLTYRQPTYPLVPDDRRMPCRQKGDRYAGPWRGWVDPRERRSSGEQGESDRGRRPGTADTGELALSKTERWRYSMPGFIQIMEFETSQIDELETLMKTFQEERGDALLATKATITEDRTRPNHYLVIVEFDSYEEAMKNSND